MSPRLSVALLVVGFVACSLPVFLGAFNHDEAWYLWVARRVLAGDRLYVDIFDTNPPLIIWLNLPPVLLARAVGITEILAVRLLVLGLVAASVGLTGWILRRALPDRPGARLALLLLTIVALVSVVGYDFAQREHLMLILAMPYLWMASARASGSQFEGGIPWLVGLMAGVGLAIKPHFGLLWLAVEAMLVLRRDWRIAFRPEGLAIAAVGLIYGVAALTLAPDYLPWIRRITSVYYGAGNPPFATLATDPGTILALLAVFGFLILRPEGQARWGIEVLAAANLALLAIALIQLKGFPYQFYPPMALAILLMGRLLVEFTPAPGDRANFVLMVRVILPVVLISVAASRVRESIAWAGRPGDSDTQLGRMIRVAREHLNGGSLFAFSPAVPAGFPMVNYVNAGWACPHPALLFLPGCYTGGSAKDEVVVTRSPAEMGDSERFLFDGVVARLLKDQPTVLFVDETGSPLAFNGRRFDYLAYYRQDPRFAEFIDEYEPLERIDQFRVYRRKAKSQPKP